MTEPKLFGELVTPNEAAGALGISAATVRRWLRAGDIPGQKIGRQWRVEVERLREALAQMAAGTKTAEQPSDDFPTNLEGRRIYCPICTAPDAYNLERENGHEFRCQACGAVFSIKRGPLKEPVVRRQMITEEIQSEIQVPSVYERSPKRQQWYAIGFEDALDRKEITDQFLVDLTMRQGTRITAAYQHGYEDGLALQAGGKPAQQETSE